MHTLGGRGCDRLLVSYLHKPRLPVFRVCCGFTSPDLLVVGDEAMWCAGLIGSCVLVILACASRFSGRSTTMYLEP